MDNTQTHTLGNWFVFILKPNIFLIYFKVYSGVGEISVGIDYSFRDSAINKHAPKKILTSSFQVTYVKYKANINGWHLVCFQNHRLVTKLNIKTI